MRWTNPSVTGKEPLPRANHSSAVVADRLFIFGGWDGKRRLNDIHVLHAPTLTWSAPEIKGTPPSPRAGMTLTCVRGHLYLFGGSGPNAKCFKDLRVFDHTDMRWLDVTNEAGNHKDKRGRSGDMDDFSDASGIQIGSSSLAVASNPNSFHQHVRGDVHIIGVGPKKRAGHTTTVIGRRLFIFGGSHAADYLSDCFVLDTDPTPEVEITAKPSAVQIQTSMSRFLNCEEFSDIEFEVGDHIIYAHKIILCLLSERFRAMFSSGFREASQKRIIIHDVRYNVFMKMMEYLYTGAAPELAVDDSADIQADFELVMDLLQCSDQFMLDHLKEICEMHLASVVGDESVDILLEHAEMCNAVQLKDVCVHFKRNRGESEWTGAQKKSEFPSKK